MKINPTNRQAAEYRRQESRTSGDNNEHCILDSHTVVQTTEQKCPFSFMLSTRLVHSISNETDTNRLQFHSSTSTQRTACNTALH